VAFDRDPHEALDHADARIAGVVDADDLVVGKIELGMSGGEQHDGSPVDTFPVGCGWRRLGASHSCSACVPAVAGFGEPAPGDTAFRDIVSESSTFRG